MSVFFELIDRKSGNVIKDYETEAAALSELEDVVKVYGFDDIRDFALLKFQDGLPIQAAMDDELVQLVKAIDLQHWGGETTAETSLLPNIRTHQAFELRLEPTTTATFTTASIAYETSPIQWPGRPPLEVQLTDKLTATRQMDLVCVA